MQPCQNQPRIGGEYLLYVRCITDGKQNQPRIGGEYWWTFSVASVESWNQPRIGGEYLCLVRGALEP